METENRKRPGSGGEAEERRTKAREEKKEQTATEDEVEEFFAILRRIHAVKYPEKVIGEGRKLPEKGSRWRPEFVWEDFEEVKVGEKRHEGVEESHHLGLDLNVEPA